MTAIRSAAAVGRETEDGTVSVSEIGIASETVTVNATANVIIEIESETGREIATGIACLTGIESGTESVNGLLTGIERLTDASANETETWIVVTDSTAATIWIDG